MSQDVSSAFELVVDNGQMYLAIIALVLSGVTTERYLEIPCHLARAAIALEAKYEPIGQLKTANKLLSNQIAAIRDEEQFVLTLSQREPTITLLGVLGEAVAAGQ